MSDTIDDSSSRVIIASGVAASLRAKRYLPTAEFLEGSTVSHSMWKAYDSDEGVEVAMHVIPLSGDPFSEESSRDNARMALERGLGADVHHPHIVCVLDSWVEPSPSTAPDGSSPLAPWRLCFITPIVSAGTLQSYVARIDDVRVRVVRKWCRQMLGGLDYLHSRGRVHGDVRLANVFINGETGNVLLGTLEAVGMGVGASARDARYAAPHIEPSGVRTTFCDVWAFGLCILEITTRRTAYSSYGPDLMDALVRDRSSGVLPAELADIDAKVAAVEERETAEAQKGDKERMREASEKTADIVALRSIIRSCLSIDPAARPSVSSLLEHDFLRERADEREKERGAVGAVAAAAAATVAAVAAAGAAANAGIPFYSTSLQTAPPVSVQESASVAAVVQLQQQQQHTVASAASVIHVVPTPSAATIGNLPTSSSRSSSHTYTNTLGSHTYTITLAGAGVSTNAESDSIPVAPGATGVVSAQASQPVTEQHTISAKAGSSAGPGVQTSAAPAVAQRMVRRAFLPANSEPPALLGMSFRGVHFSRAHAQVTMVLYYPLSPNGASSSSPPLHVLQRLIRFVVSRSDDAETAPARLAAELVVAHLAAASDLPRLLNWLSIALVPVLVVPAYVVLDCGTAVRTRILGPAVSAGGRSRATSNATTGAAWTDAGDDEEDEDEVGDDRSGIAVDDEDEDHEDADGDHDAVSEADRSRSVGSRSLGRRALADRSRDEAGEGEAHGGTGGGAASDAGSLASQAGGGPQAAAAPLAPPVSAALVADAPQ